MAGRQAEQRLRLLDGTLQARLAFIGAVRAAEKGVVEALKGPARALGAGAGGKIAVDRPLGRLARRRHIETTLPDRRPSVGRGLPPARIGARPSNVKKDRFLTLTSVVRGQALV